MVAFICVFLFFTGRPRQTPPSTPQASIAEATPTGGTSLDATGYARRGQEYYDAANWKLAEKSYREAVDLDPANEPYNFMLGQSLYAQSRFAEAEIAFRAAVALSPNSGFGKRKSVSG